MGGVHLEFMKALNDAISLKNAVSKGTLGTMRSTPTAAELAPRV